MSEERKPNFDRQTLYDPLKEALVLIKNIVEFDDPENWGYGTARKIIQLRRNLDKLPLEAQEYTGTLFPFAISILKSDSPLERQSGTTDEEHRQSIGTATQSNLYRAYDLMVHENENVEILHSNYLPYEEIVQRKPESCRISGEGQTGDPRVFWLKSHSRDEWFPIPLPITDRIIKKGGEPRAVTKVLAGAPVETIENEYPFNDSDGIAIGKREDVLQESQILGIDPDGLEMVNEMDIPRILSSRDLDINATLMTREGLYYTDDAFQAARTGHIKLYTNLRGIFGPIVFYYDNHELATNRGLGRLMKTVAEGKALSFDFLPLNQNIDFGIYWLIFARKYQRKFQDNPTMFGTMMQKIHYLAGQAGQIRPDEHQLIDTLDRSHVEHPNFDFDDPKLDEVGVARWLNRYLYKSLLRYYRQLHSIPRNFEYERTANDSTPYKISLAGFEPDYNAAAELAQDWEKYLDRCRSRRKEFLLSENISNVV